MMKEQIEKMQIQHDELIDRAFDLLMIKIGLGNKVTFSKPIEITKDNKIINIFEISITDTGKVYYQGMQKKEQVMGSLRFVNDTLEVALRILRELAGKDLIQLKYTIQYYFNFWESSVMGVPNIFGDYRLSNPVYMEAKF